MSVYFAAVPRRTRIFHTQGLSTSQVRTPLSSQAGLFAPLAASGYRKAKFYDAITRQWLQGWNWNDGWQLEYPRILDSLPEKISFDSRQQFLLPLSECIISVYSLVQSSTSELTSATDVGKGFCAALELLLVRRVSRLPCNGGQHSSTTIPDRRHLPFLKGETVDRLGY